MRPEERAECHLGPGAGVVLEFVVAAGADDFVVGIGEILAVCPQTVIVVRFVRCADEQLEAVSSELAGCRRGRVVVAVPCGRDQLVEGVELRIGDLRDRAVGVGVVLHEVHEPVGLDSRELRCGLHLEGEPPGRPVFEGRRGFEDSVLADVVAAHAQLDHGQGIDRASGEGGVAAVGPLGEHQRVFGVHECEDAFLVGIGGPAGVGGGDVEPEIEPFVHPDVHVVAQVEPLEIGIFDDGVLVEIAQRGHHPDPVAAGAHVQGCGCG